MRRTITKSSQRTTLKLVSAGKEESGSASSPFGPVRAGLITTQRTNEVVQLTELLNYLERKIAELSIRSCEVLNIFLSGTNPPVKLGTSSLNIDITNAIQK